MFKGLVPLIILVSALKGVSLSAIEINTIIEMTLVVGGYIAAAVSGMVALYGLIRKIAVKFQ
jgi:hypothetical protein